MQKTRFSQKLSNLELWCQLMAYRKLCKLDWAFQRTHYWIPTIEDGRDTPSWKSTWRHFFCRVWFDLDKISQTGTEWHVDCGDVWKCKPDVEIQYGGSLGEFSGMSSQSHVSINQSINQTWQFLTRRNTAKPLQGRNRTRPPRPTLWESR